MPPGRRRMPLSPSPTPPTIRSVAPSNTGLGRFVPAADHCPEKLTALLESTRLALPNGYCCSSRSSAARDVPAARMMLRIAARTIGRRMGTGSPPGGPLPESDATGQRKELFRPGSDCPGPWPGSRDVAPARRADRKGPTSPTRPAVMARRRSAPTPPPPAPEPERPGQRTWLAVAAALILGATGLRLLHAGIFVAGGQVRLFSGAAAWTGPRC